jgi:hypothetical protein
MVWGIKVKALLVFIVLGFIAWTYLSPYIGSMLSLGVTGTLVATLALLYVLWVKVGKKYAS